MQHFSFRPHLPKVFCHLSSLMNNNKVALISFGYHGGHNPPLIPRS